MAIFETPLKSSGWTVENGNVIAGSSWGYPDVDGTVEDGLYATNTIASYGQTASLECVEFDFFEDIPLGATITGMEFKIKRKASRAGAVSQGSSWIFEGFTYADGRIGNSKIGAEVPTDWETVTYGGPDDMWGTTTLTDILVRSDTDDGNTQFGVVTNFVALNTSVIVYVDACWMKIYYLKPDGGHSFLSLSAF